MDFSNVKVAGHEANFQERLFLEVWLSTKDQNAGNDHIAIPEVYKSPRDTFETLRATC